MLYPEGWSGQNVGRAPTRAPMSRFFICHASEDKAAFAEPLSRRLQELGHAVWLSCPEFGGR
jgi:hypothetical protein